LRVLLPQNNISNRKHLTTTNKPLLVVVTGATASGKTSLAIDIALQLGTEIISADSRQIYKGVPITTAVPTPDELSRVKHHLIEVLNLDQYYSAACFENDAMQILPNLFEKYGCAVVCGGSMMYVDALVNGIDDMPTITDAVRNRVIELYAQHGAEGLLAMLEINDPAFYAEVDRTNIKRVMHALEVTMQAGVPYSTLRTGGTKERPFRTLKVAIDHPREVLFDRINRRVDIMVSQGMEQEARNLYSLRRLNSLNTVGFKEWFAHFDGTLDRETTIARIAKNTRVYAKKQLTWLRRDPSVVWLPGDNPLQAFNEALARFDSENML
jgi:tRNA dimethylallyltransferase